MSDVIIGVVSLLCVAVVAAVFVLRKRSSGSKATALPQPFPVQTPVRVTRRLQPSSTPSGVSELRLRNQEVPNVKTQESVMGPMKVVSLQAESRWEPTPTVEPVTPSLSMHMQLRRQSGAALAPAPKLGQLFATPRTVPSAPTAPMIDPVRVTHHVAPAAKTPTAVSTASATRKRISLVCKPFS